MKFLGISSLIILVLLAWSTDSVAQEKQRMFVGAKKCRTCHKKPEQGAQYIKWEESAHSKAYATLAGAKAKEYGAARGVENPQTAAECLKCHVTAFQVDAKLLDKKYDMTEGVACESCHGAGEEYSKKKVMEGLMTGEVDPASVGLKKPKAEDCMTCHNDESPAFKGFDFDEYFAKMAHPIPDSTKASYQGGQ